jgi:uncharacterized protein (TIRG00374 family)
MKVYCASMIWGLFLPTTMGADAVRAYSTARAGLDSNEIVASIIVERMVGFLSGLLLALVGLLLLSILGFELPMVLWPGAIILAGAMILFGVSFSDRVFSLVHDQLLSRFRTTRIMQRLRQIHSTYQAYQHNKSSLASFFGLTFSEQLLPIVHAWLIALGLGIDASFFFMAAVLPLAILISRIPISVDGLGVFEAIFIVLMSLAGISVAQAVAISFVSRVVQILSWLPWWCADFTDRQRIVFLRPAP